MKNKEKTIRIVSLTLAVLLLFSSLFTATAYAVSDEPNTPKEEVIYINLNSDGSINNVCAVNIFELNGGGTIIDYGVYSSVKNLTTTDEISYDNHCVRINTASNRLYYEGEIESAEIPWDIDVAYYLNGKLYTAEDIAGKSGKLEIRISVSQNSSCNNTFYENYTLQATVVLNSENCTNINAPDASFANVGKNKQLTYTVLPGNDLDTVIRADVTDFEMDDIQINGIKMNLNIDIDTSSIIVKAGQLYNGAVKLDNGAAKLVSSVGELSTGLNTLKNKSTELNDATNELVDNYFELVTEKLRSMLIASGVDPSEANAVTLTQQNYKTVIATLSSTPTNAQITEAERSIRNILSSNGITDTDAQSLAMSLAYDILSSGETNNVNDALGSACRMLSDAQSVQMALGTYQGQIASNPTLAALYAALQAPPYSMNAQSAVAVTCTAYALDGNDPSSQIPTAIQKVQNANVVNSTSVNASKINDLCKTAVMEQTQPQLTALLNGLNKLMSYKSAVSEYTGGVDAAANGSAEILSGVNELKTGTAQLKNETNGIEGQINEKINDTLGSLNGDGTTVSFISEKNTNVKAVQFVIKVKGVDFKESESTQQKTVKEKSFWEKFIDLFH